MTLRKKKTNVEYRIKKLSKSPHKIEKDSPTLQQKIVIPNQTTMGFMLKCRPTIMMDSPPAQKQTNFIIAQTSPHVKGPSAVPDGNDGAFQSLS
jgi:hypothetical protein